MGKGDTYRPVNKKKYDKSYLRIYGVKCPNCEDNAHGDYCPTCKGIGYIPKDKR